MPNTAQKAKISPGDVVCVTKLTGIHQNEIKNGDQFFGTLRNNIIEGRHLVVNKLNPTGRGLETSRVHKYFVSVTAIVVMTSNIYTWWKNCHKPPLSGF